MTSERVTLYRVTDDDQELIEQLPKTVASQVYDDENEQFLNVTLESIKPASLTQSGLVQLSNSINSTDDTKASTPGAVKITYDKAVQAFDLATSAFQSASDGKELLSISIAGKGQTVASNATFQEFADAIDDIVTGPNTASGVITSSTNTSSIAYKSGANAPAVYTVTVSGLDFTPTKIHIYASSGYSETHYDSDVLSNLRGVLVYSYTTTITNPNVYNYNPNSGSCYINSTGFKLPVINQNASYRWKAEG